MNEAPAPAPLPGKSPEPNARRLGAARVLDGFFVTVGNDLIATAAPTVSLLAPHGDVARRWCIRYSSEVVL